MPLLAHITALLLRHCLWLLLCALLCGAPGMPLLAAQQFSLIDPYFEAVGSNEVIPEGAVMALTQDARGLLWIGTQKGLVQYDGYRFRKFVHARREPGSLGGDYVWCLWGAPDGRVWVGTVSNGVSVFDPRNEQFSHYRHDPKQAGSLGEGIVWAMSDDGKGGMWIGTDHGLAHLGAGASQFEHLRQQPGQSGSLADNRIRSLLRDKDGNLWVGSVGGLQKLQADGQHFGSLLAAGQEVVTLFQAQDGKLWLGTRQDGAFWFDPASLSAQVGTPIHAISAAAAGENLGQRWITSIRQVQDQQIWIATRGGGVLVVSASDGKLLRQLHHDASIPSTLRIDEIRTLWLDHSGLLWLGSNGGGLMRFNGNNRAISLMHHSPGRALGLSDPSVQSIVQLPDATLLLGTTGNGIDILDQQGQLQGGHRPNQTKNPSGNQSLKQPGSLPGNQPASQPASQPATGSVAAGFPKSSVRALHAGSDGTLWAGTQDAGLWQLAPGAASWQGFGLKQGLPDIWAERVLLAKDGTLWVGTPSGVVRRPPGESRFLPCNSSDGSVMRAHVTALRQDQQGQIWIASAGGLWQAAAGSTTLRRASHEAQRPDSLSSDTVLGLLLDQQQQLWLTTTRGLDRLLAWPPSQPARFEHVADIVGEANMVIGENLLQDGLGRIWSAEFVYDPAQQRLTPLSRADGFDIGTSHLGSFAKLTDGRLLFGGTEGLAIVEPERFQPWAFQPPVVLTALKINGKYQPAGQGGPGSNSSLRIEPGQRNFSIEFAALDYSNPAQNRYRYRLQGYDKEWIEVDADHRSASYGNLWPGQYTLQVEGSNRLGVWSPHHLILPIRVLPNFWQTWWFALALLMLLGSGGFALLRWRENAMRSQARQESQALQQLVATRTADIVATHDKLASAHGQLEASHQALAQSHQELACAHQHLKETQSQLIQSEKMASLGQLIASVAHEINTPLGAVKSSGSHIARTLEKILSELPQLYQMLSLPEQQLFMNMLLQAQASPGVLTSREERQLKRDLRSQLEQAGIVQPEQSAAILVQLRAWPQLAELMLLLRHAQAPFILQCAYNLSSIINSTNNINLAVARVSKIVFALKSYTRHSKNGGQQEMVLARISEGLETVLTLYYPQIKSQIELVREFEEIEPMLCLPDELNQVWTNLIHNALQAMNYHGTLSLSLRRLGELVEVRVQDSGCGIAPEHLDKIFDPFFTTKPSGEGSGLGLDIVKKIIEKHHGRIEVETRVGVGTCFVVILPIRTSMAAAPEAAAPEATK